MSPITPYNAVQQAAICAALAKINQPHLQFWCEHNQMPSQPYDKLLNKLLAYLRGELKSDANLLRFHEEFAQWRELLPEADNLAYRIAESCAAALYTGVEALFDDECQDLQLSLDNIATLHQEFAELGGEAEPMQQYWQELQQELDELLNGVKQRPLGKAYFVWLKDQQVSLFGMD